MLKHPVNKDGKRTYGGGSGAGDYYIVEARSTFGQPQIVSVGITSLSSYVLDAEWRRVPTDGEGEYKIPCRPYMHREAQECGLMNYEAALAFAYLFIAVMEAQFSSTCVEARLVKVHLQHSYETWEVGVGDIINRTDGERPKFSERETEDIPLTAREIKA